MADERLPAKPAWETDFPIERVEAQHVSRREFAKFLVVVSGGMTLGSAVIAVKDELIPRATLTHAVRLAGVDDVPIGGMAQFTVPGTNLPGILVRVDDSTFAAFEQKCTHLSCAVYYVAERQRIECPCHNGAFDVRSGAVIQGPAPRGLHRFAVEVRDGSVFLSAEPKAGAG
jgi:cytochrome b6-f complex iron-sulfur subunit